MHTLDQAAPGAHTSANHRPQSRDRRAIARTLARRCAPIRGLREAKTQMTMEANDMTTNSGPRAVSAGEAHLGGQRLERLRRTGAATDPKAATGRRQRAKPLSRTLRTAALLLVALSAIGAHPTVVRAETEVPANWSLIPTGLGPGDSFRLIFIPSTGIDGGSSALSFYDNHVQSAAAGGHTDIQAYSSAFKMLGSTRLTDARDHTGTTGIGVPIYWLNGAKVADNYADFYDGTWDEEAQGRRESGAVVNLTSAWQIWTGSTHEGTELFATGGNTRALGQAVSGNLVGVGKPNSTTSGHGPLAGQTADKNGSKAVYALSDVFIVASNPTWSLTLTDSSGNAVTELTEGGAGATATISITNNVRFNTAQSVTLKWGGNEISSGPIVGADGRATITIAAGSASASRDISAPQEIHPRYQPATTLALSADFMGAATGASLNLTFISNDPAPSAKISSAPNAVVEGGSVEFRIGLSHPATVPIEVKFGVTDPDGALSGTPPTSVQVPALQTEATVNLTADDNSVQNDGTREVTLALALDADEPYTLGTPSSITVQVLDNDATGDNTPPVVVTAQALSIAFMELKFSEIPVITFDGQNLDSANFVGGSYTSPVFTITSGGRTLNAHITNWNTERMLIDSIGDMLSTDIISLAYTKPAINPIADAAGNEMPSFTGVFVRNSIPRVPPDRPGNLRIRASGTGAMTLAWSAAAHKGTPISAYQVRHARGTTPSGGWTTVQGGGAARSHQFTNLTVGASYTFEVRAVSLGGASSPQSIDGIPVRPGVHVDTRSIFEGESARLNIIPQGAPFGTLKRVTVVLASHSGPDQAKPGSDFWLIWNGIVRGREGKTFNQGGFSGIHPHYDVFITQDETDLTADIVAIDDDVSECRESVTAFAYLDYDTPNQRQIGTGQRIAIFDNDNRPNLDGVDLETDLPTLESATVDGRTVTLTFNGDLTEANPGDDPFLEEGEVPLRAPMFFTLFEAVGPGVAGPNDDNRGNANFYTHPYGTGARTFALDGRTVTLTFPHRVDTSHMAWIRYEQHSRYSPLGMTLPEPTPGRCVAPVGVDSFTSNIPMGANTADDDPLPVITIDDVEKREGTGPMVFTVTLTPASTELVTVNFRTIARTASSAMTDTNGNIHGDFWPVAGTLQFQPTETEKTVSVQIVDDSVEDDGETFLLDLAEASGATMDDRTSFGTGTIRNSEDAPTGNEHVLTASFANVPAEHGGGGEANRFSFDLTFSENPEVSYRTLRDNHAFTVTGGAVKKAKRKVRGSNQSWTITVEPSGWDNVNITLPGNRACSASNAVCMPDGRQLSNSPSATIRGPAALSIADATANENSDSGLNFVVSLDRVSTLTVTVDYATSDGTATAGHDYTATSGTLTFNPGDAAKSINVALLDDAVDDGGETMTVTLSNASNARIADATATGTIENSDPLQQAWIARFGRTVAADVVDGITERLESRGAHSEVRIAGRTLQHNGGTWTEAPVEDAELVDPLEGTQPFETNEVMSVQELMLNSSFRLQGAMDETGGPAWGAWGRFSASSFEGEADGVTLSGDVVTGLLGADVGTDTWTAGIALSAAKGDGPFQLVDDGAGATNGPCDRGTVESTLTSIHPYAELSVTDAVDVWAIGGYGTGDMTIDHTACEAFKTDIDMMMAAAGVRGQVLSTEGGDALDSTVRTDVLWLHATSDRTESLSAAEADVRRLRLMIDAGRSFTAGAGTLTPTIEAGVRHDAGDAEEGVGLEVGAGLAYQGTGISIEGKVRTLVAHDDSAYEEWGASFAVRIDPGSDGRGLSLSITPTWGSAASEADQLWSTRTAEDLVSENTFEAERRVDAALGYGVGGPGGFGTLTPYAGLSLANSAKRTVRSGVRWNASENATLGLEAVREQGAETQGTNHAVLLRAQVRF